MDKLIKIALAVFGVIFFIFFGSVLVLKLIGDDCTSGSTSQDCVGNGSSIDTVSTSNSDTRSHPAPVMAQKNEALLPVWEKESVKGIKFLPALEAAPTSFKPQNAQQQAVLAKTKPACRLWHKARKGETQWSIASVSVSHSSKMKSWLQSMRWISNKQPGDESLKPGELICVAW